MKYKMVILTNYPFDVENFAAIESQRDKELLDSLLGIKDTIVNDMEIPKGIRQDLLDLIFAGKAYYQFEKDNVFEDGCYYNYWVFKFDEKKNEWVSK